MGRPARDGSGPARLPACAELEAVRGLLHASRRVVALTGAGISTDSGIPDFRGPCGLWTLDPSAERMATLRHYLADPALRRRAWQARLRLALAERRPNAGHRALAALERRGALRALITQNVDGLHQRAGNSPARVIEIHGTLLEVECTGCGARGPMHAALARVRAGEPDPDCARCGGILKSATVYFGQNVRREDWQRARRAVLRCDLLLAVGTSLAVHPVSGVVPLARDAGAHVVIVNGEPTRMDDAAHAVLRGSISRLLTALIAPGQARDCA